MLKLALDAPAATVTDEGTCAALVLLLARATVTPPFGAAAVIDTVPCACAWLLTEDWLSEISDSARPWDPDPGPGAGPEGFDGAPGVGLGEDGVPLPQPVTEITKLVTNRNDRPHGNARRIRTSQGGDTSS